MCPGGNASIVVLASVQRPQLPSSQLASTVRSLADQPTDTRPDRDRSHFRMRRCESRLAPQILTVRFHVVLDVLQSVEFVLQVAPCPVPHGIVRDHGDCSNAPNLQLCDGLSKQVSRIATSICCGVLRCHAASRLSDSITAVASASMDSYTGSLSSPVALAARIAP